MKAKQTGFTLMELLIATVISAVVVTGMIALMANTLGSSTVTIGMTRLTEELRAAMQIVSRDVRRAGFYGDIVSCIAQGTCGGSADFSPVELIAQSGGSADCIRVAYDRDGDNTSDGVPSEVVFFRYNVTSSVGRIQLKTSGNATDADCSEGTWTDITDPRMIHISNLEFDDTGTFTTVISSSSDGDTTVTTRIVEITMTGNLIGNTDIQRQIVNEVRVRNDLFAAP